MHLSPSTLGDWAAAAADMLEPIYKRARARTLVCYLLSLDDTGMPVLDREHPNGIKRGHLWTYLGDAGRIGFCEYTPTWEQDPPCAVIAEFQGEVVQADGYAGIDAAFRRPDAPVRAGCMDPLPTTVRICNAGWRRPGLDRGRSYRKALRRRGDARRDGADLDELLRLRRELSQPVMDQLQRVVADLHQGLVPLGKATTYAIRQWDTLTVFLDDARVPLSNAHVERQQRRTGLSFEKMRCSRAPTKEPSAWPSCKPSSSTASCTASRCSPTCATSLGKLAASWPHSRLDELLPDAWAGRAETTEPRRSSP